MTELRLQIDDRFLRDLRINLRSNAKATEIVRDALTLYNWAAEERANGRLILSSKPDGSDFARLVMPALEQAAPPAIRHLEPDSDAPGWGPRSPGPDAGSKPETADATP